MKRANDYRNWQVWSLWKGGYTIDKISVLTGVPRSTVGYYVKKFKRYRARGQPLFFGRSEVQTPEATPLDSLITKGLWFKKMFEVMKHGDWEELYHFLMCSKCLIELHKYIRPTPEEQKLLNESLISLLKGIIGSADRGNSWFPQG